MESRHFRQDHSIRAGWGLFDNPVEQLVLEQFSAEPPFVAVYSLAETFFNTPFYAQAGFVDPNPFNGIPNPPRGQPVDWSIYRPILLFGQFQPHMRSQYSVQYNFGIQRESAKNLVLPASRLRRIPRPSVVGLHPLEPGHSTNLSGYRRFHRLDDPGNVTSFGDPATCNQFAEDNQLSVTVPTGFNFHMPGARLFPGWTNPQFLLLAFAPFPRQTAWQPRA